MEAGTSSPYASILIVVVLIAIGWLIGQMFPWRRLRHPVARVSGDGGIDYLIYDVDYTITRDSNKRTEVELKGHIYDFSSGEGKVYVSAETFSPSPIADEMHRIHNAGAMICSLRPAEKRSKRKDDSGDRSPVTVEPPEED